MAKDIESVKERNWLSLGLASSLLEINEATLRQWADNGLVRAYRTPGGHRRFAREDLDAMLEQGQRSSVEEMVSSPEIDAAVLSQVRRRMGGARPHPPAWHTGFDQPGHERMRVLGRRLISLCTESLAQRKQALALAAAKNLGQDQGTEAALQGVPLADTIKAFIFFRGAVLDAFREALLRAAISVHELTRCWSRLNRLTDEALLGLVGAYQKSEALAVAKTRRN